MELNERYQEFIIFVLTKHGKSARRGYIALELARKICFNTE